MEAVQREQDLDDEMGERRRDDRRIRQEPYSPDDSYMTLDGPTRTRRSNVGMPDDRYTTLDGPTGHPRSDLEMSDGRYMTLDGPSRNPRSDDRYRATDRPAGEPRSQVCWIYGTNLIRMSSHHSLLDCSVCDVMSL